jgi:hypothetical protein
VKLKVWSVEAADCAKRCFAGVDPQARRASAKLAHKVIYIRGMQSELPMCTAGWTLDTLGKSYEVRGNGADGSHWRDKPLYGSVTHLPTGGIFTPAPGTIPDGRFYADFVGAIRAGREALPAHGRTRSAKDQNHCANTDRAKAARFWNPTR